MQEENKVPVQAEEDLNEILRIRREKLSALQEAGRNPFDITVCDRDTLNSEIAEHFDELEGKTVTTVSYTHLDVYKRQPQR